MGYTNHSGNCLSYGDECATGVESLTNEGDGYSLFSGTIASSQENGPNITLAFSDSKYKHERGQTRWIINTNPVKIYTQGGVLAIGRIAPPVVTLSGADRSEEHTSELQ